MNIFHSNNLFKSISAKSRKTNETESFVYFPIKKGVKKCKFNIKSQECEYIKDFLLPELEKTKTVNENTPTEEFLLDFHLIPNSNNIVIAGANSKKVIVYDEIESTKLFEYTHSKKFSNCIIFTENGENYAIFSDKFGEIFLLHLNINNNNNSNLSNNNSKDNNSSDKAYLLYGHAEVVSFLIKNDKYIISSDALSKIKICHFPNVFEINSAILYDNYRFISIIADNYLLVVNNSFNIHIWDLESVKQLDKFDFKLDSSLKQLIVLNEYIIYSNTNKFGVLKLDTKKQEIKEVFSYNILENNDNSNSNNNILDNKTENSLNKLSNLCSESKNNKEKEGRIVCTNDKEIYLFENFDESKENSKIEVLKKTSI